MRFSNPVRLRQQVQFLQRQFLQEGDLPFTDVLSTEIDFASIDDGRGCVE